MTRDIDRDVIRENEPDHIAYISFLNYVLFTFFPDRLSFYTFHPVSRGRHGFQLFEMMNAVFMTQGAAFVENYGCVNLSRPPDPAFQEATEERIVSRNSGPILGVSMVSITCPLFFKSRHIFLLSFFLLERDVLLWQAMPRSVSIYNSNCGTEKTQIYFRQPGFLSSEGTFSIWSSSHFCPSRKPNPRESYTYGGICHMVYQTPLFLAFNSHLGGDSKASGGLLWSPAFKF